MTETSRNDNFDENDDHGSKRNCALCHAARCGKNIFPVRIREIEVLLCRLKDTCHLTNAVKQCLIRFARKERRTNCGSSGFGALELHPAALPVFSYFFRPGNKPVTLLSAGGPHSH